MPRQMRIEYENAVYHVMNRARDRQFIFLENDHFGLSHYSSVTQAISRLEASMSRNELNSYSEKCKFLISEIKT